MGSIARSTLFAILVFLYVLLLSTACAVNPKPLGYRLIQKGEVERVSWSRVHRSLEFLWSYGEVEYLGCLNGEMSGDTLHILGVEIAEIIEAGPKRVKGLCRRGREHVGMIHPHRGGRCYPSATDTASFNRGKDDAFLVIQCASNRVWVSTAKVRVRSRS